MKSGLSLHLGNDLPKILFVIWHIFFFLYKANNVKSEGTYMINIPNNEQKASTH